MRGEPYIARLQIGLGRPKNTGVGADLAGQVEAVGRNVTRFRPGDEVFGQSMRTMAEYACVSQDGLADKPANMTFEQAAAVPVAASTALQGLRDKAHVQPGQKVLINGAAGGVGTFAVQIAKTFGAEVTGVCSTRNVAMVRSIGADHVIDYTKEDFTAGGQRYDVMLELVRSKTVAACMRALTSDGTLLMAAGEGGRWLGPIGRQAAALVLSPLVGQKFCPFLAKRSQADFHLLKGLLESGQVTPVIDRTYPLSDTADAIRYIETGHARGKVVVTV